MARNSRTKATHSTGNNRSEHHVSPESSPHNRAGPTRSIAHAPTVRSQAHETLRTMTTIIMRTSDDNRCGRFWLCSKAFNFWETYRLPSFSTRHLQAPENNPGALRRPPSKPGILHRQRRPRSLAFRASHSWQHGEGLRRSTCAVGRIAFGVPAS